MIMNTLVGRALKIGLRRKSFSSFLERYLPKPKAPEILDASQVNLVTTNNAFKFSQPSYMAVASSFTDTEKTEGMETTLLINKTTLVNEHASLLATKNATALQMMQRGQWCSKNEKGELIFESPFGDIDIPLMNASECLLGDLDLTNPHAHGDKPAFQQNSNTITYNEVKQQSLLLAYNLLTKLKIKEGEKAMIISRNTIEYPAIILGCGAALVPISPVNPDASGNPHDLAYFIDMVKPAAVFLQESFVAPFLTALNDHTSADLTNLSHLILMHDDSTSSNQDNVLEDSPLEMVLSKLQMTSHLNIYRVKELFAGSLLEKYNGDLSQVISLHRKNRDPKAIPMLIPFSSGTTGLPKGVLLSHYNMVANYYQVTLTKSYIRDSDVLLGMLPLFHMYGSIIFLFSIFHWGCKTVLLEKYNPRKFCEMVQKHKVTSLFTVPPVVIMLAKSELCDRYDLSSLKTLFVAAAPINIDVIKLFMHRYPAVQYITQGYGMSELSPITHMDYYGSGPEGSITRILSDAIGSDENLGNANNSLYRCLGSVGYLAPNCKMKIVSTEDTDSLEHVNGRNDKIYANSTVGYNTRGELYISGPNVMMGYLNNLKANRETLTEDGYLKTGDIVHVYYDPRPTLANLLTNNKLFIIEREKELIKVKGFQVAPAELEGKLLKHPQILDCCVVPVPDERSGEQPKAFVVRRDHKGDAVTKKEILDWFNAQVGNLDYKRIKEVEFIDQIPKSNTGKILRRKLRALHTNTQ